MKAMRIVPTVFWRRDIETAAGRLCLAELMPRCGESRTVYVEAQAGLNDGDTAHLLWLPPYSEINGWAEQPSEIAASQIVTGTVRWTRSVGSCAPGASRLEALIAHSVEFEVSVTGCQGLLAACRQAQDDAGSAGDADAGAHGGQAAWDFPRVRSLSAGVECSQNLWAGAGWCGIAQVEGFIYLSGTAQEASLDLLLRRESGALLACYQETTWPGQTAAVLGRKPLHGDDPAVIEHCLARAQALHDHVDYLA